MSLPLDEQGCLLRAEAARLRAELTAINAAMSVVYDDLRQVEESVRALPAGAGRAEQLAQRRRLLHDWRRLLQQQHACLVAGQENVRARWQVVHAATWPRPVPDEGIACLLQPVRAEPCV